MHSRNRNKSIEVMFRRGFLATFLAIVFNPGQVLAARKKRSLIVHHTLFWLKDPKSEGNKTTLIENLRTLIRIEDHRTLIGVPIKTIDYEGTDSSYDVSIVTYFDNVDQRVTYQNHPVHQAFFFDNKGLWDRFVSYDTFCEIP
jgi:hypothetical protein